MSPITYKKWVVKNQAVNRQYVFDDEEKNSFEIVEHTVDPDSLTEGQILIKNIYFSNDPALKFWIYSPYADYGNKIPVGGDIPSRGIGIVVKSKDAQFKEGDYVATTTNWAEYNVVQQSKTTYVTKIDIEAYKKMNVPLHFDLSVFGLTAESAYMGLTKVGELGTNEESYGKNFLVTGAAGAVGSVVVQLARNVFKANKIYAIAGGEEKMKLVESFGDNVIAIDYKDKNFKENCKKIMKESSIDVFFDNVGGDIFESLLPFMAQRSTIISCGSISVYNDEKPKPFYSLTLIITKRIKLQGFILGDYMKDIPKAKKDLMDWYSKGYIKEQSTIVDCEGENFSKVPKTWYGLFEGINKGKLITQVSKP